MGSEYDRGVCVNCEIGYYRNSSVATSCQPCPRGYVTADTGAVEESQCVVPVAQSGRCPAGHSWVSAVERCEACPLGWYRPGGSARHCLKCPNNSSTSNPGTTAITGCIGYCGTGRQYNDTTHSCVLCPVGSYKNDTGHDTCQKCPDKQTTLYEGATEKAACFRSESLAVFTSGDCPLGTSWSAADHSCILCPRGWYRGHSHQTCVACPPGTDTLRPGAMYDTLCMLPMVMEVVQQLTVGNTIRCPLGMELSFPSGGCRLCASGTHREHRYQASCVQCPSNTSDSRLAASRVNQCKNAHSHNKGAQVTCPPGTQTNLTDASHCRQCDLGTYSATMATSSQWDQSCVDCGSGLTTLLVGSTSEEHCNIITPHPEKKAFFSQHECPAGSEWNDQLPGCTSCHRGYYRPLTSDCCVPCPSGYNTATRGSTSPRQCVVIRHRTYAPHPAHGDCPEGMQLFDGVCELCAVGTYKDSRGPGPCLMCPYDDMDHRTRTLEAGASHLAKCITTVYISSVSPRTGYMSGGVTLRMSVRTAGVDLRVNSVTVAGVPCHTTSKILNDGNFKCQLPRSQQPATGYVTMEIQWGPVYIRSHSSVNVYSILATPAVRRLERTRVFVSGGVYVNVSVDQASSVAQSHALWYRQNGGVHPVKVTPCTVTTTTTLSCTVPDLHEAVNKTLAQNDDRKKRDVDTVTTATKVYLGFDLDSWMYFRNLSEVLMGTSLSSFVTVYDDPLVYDFDSNDGLVLMSQQNGSLFLQGERLDLGCVVEDYDIVVGQSYQCMVTELRSTNLTCQVNGEDISRLIAGVNYQIQVKIGDFIYHPGFIQLQDNNNSTTNETHTTHNPVMTSESATETTTVIISGDLNAMSHDTSPLDPYDKVKVIVPATITVLSLVIIVVLLTILLVNKARRRRREESSAACSEEVYVGRSWQSDMQAVDEAVLPPLPVVSVFGPDRRTSFRDRAMRQLALPPGVLTSSNIPSTDTSDIETRSTESRSTEGTLDRDPESRSLGSSQADSEREMETKPLKTTSYRSRSNHTSSKESRSNQVTFACESDSVNSSQDSNA